MARVHWTGLPIDGVSGRLDYTDKEKGYVFTQRYGDNYVCKVEFSKKDPSMAQLAQQERFAQAASKAADDMADIDKKAEWQAIADASNGKYKTARGAAFAAYYAEAGNE